MTGFRLSRPQLQSVYQPASVTSRAYMHPFADASYFQRVIGLLQSARKMKGISLKELAVLSGLRKSVITLAERDGVVPTCGEFKAWSEALGISWHQLWSMGFPLEKRNEAS